MSLLKLSLMISEISVSHVWEKSIICNSQFFFVTEASFWKTSGFYTTNIANANLYIT